jgi:3-isopropylmalate dehydratase
LSISIHHLPRNLITPHHTTTLIPTISTISRKSFKSIHSFIEEPDSRAQVGALEDNVKEFGLTYFGMGDRRQGIVHIIGPEQGFTLPGTTVVCGDSHTSSEFRLFFLDLV